jgi:gamma-glutamyl phosphate reductase
MTTYTDKAREISFAAFPVPKDASHHVVDLILSGRDTLIEVISQALQDVRNEALEEAAQKCENSVAPGIDEYMNQRLQALHDARICRALKHTRGRDE